MRYLSLPYVRAQQLTRLAADDPPAALIAAVDRFLAATPVDAALHFSGGIDSTFLAWRLRELGRTPTLVNLAFGADDPEAGHAARVAGRLGMRLERVAYDAQQQDDALARLARDYSFPFVDTSTIAAQLLVAGTAPLVSETTILDGTGADALFALPAKAARWQQLAALPAPIRKVLAGSYSGLRLWQHRSAHSPLERVARAARRLAQMPLPLAAIASNELDGIAYAIPPAERMAIEAAILSGVDAALPLAAAPARLAIADLLHVCAGPFAAKSFDAGHHFGLTMRYPFLDPDVIATASLSPTEPVKGVLKRALAEALPDALLARPKSSFLAPIGGILRDRALHPYVAATLLAPDNPLLEFCRPDILRRMLSRAVVGSPLSDGGYRFLWAMIFTSAWLRQIGSAR